MVSDMVQDPGPERRRTLASVTIKVIRILRKVNYPHLSSERSRRHILGRGDTVEVVDRSSALIDVPVYYLTLSSQYVSHEYAIASIDGPVRGFIA